MTPRAVLARWDGTALWRDRWFLIAATAFGVLTLAAASATLSGPSILGVSSFGRVAATLVHLTMLFVPLLGLTIGAGWIAGDRESGALALLTAQPLHRGTIFMGKCLGVARGIVAATLLGFGAAGIALALRTGPQQLPSFLWLIFLSTLLALASVAIGFAISATAANRSRALGAALAVWLLLTLVSDLGILATSMILRLPAPVVLVAGILNPVSAFRLAAVVGIAGSADLTGPVGIYAADRLGIAGLLTMAVGVLALWVVGALLLGRTRFVRTVES